MLYYYRVITKREPLFNGLMGYNRYLQVVLTDDIEPFNYRKRKKFNEFKHLDVRYRGLEPNKVYEFLKEW